MANLTTYSFRQIVANYTAAAQATCSKLINFAIGSVLLAIANATAAVALWLQALILQIMGLARAATSQGSDLDSWMAQFSFLRIPGTQSTGAETFGRNITTLQVLVPVGAQVQVPGGTQVFTVIADTTNPAFSVPLNSYVLAPSVAAITVTVQSVGATAAANVQSGAVTQLVSPIPGIDYVTNASAFTGATDPESDPAFRLRFIAFFAALPRATKAALSYAISQVAGVVAFSLIENQTVSGTPQLGYFFAVVDDGTGSPPGNLLTAVYNALFLAWRGFTIQYGIFAATKVTANYSATITTAAGYTHGTIVAAVTAAIVAYINALPCGATLSYGKLIQICFDTVPGAVTNVTGAVLNGSTVDLTSTVQQVIRTGTVGIG